MRLSFVGLGPVRIGMTEAQVRNVLSGLLRSDYSDDEPECHYVTPAIEGLGFMVLKSRIARIDVFEGKWRTVSGAGIGTTEAEIRRMYRNQLHLEPHPYDDRGKYMFVRPRDPKLRGYELAFETDGNVVTTFRAGLAKGVALIEGCG